MNPRERDEFDRIVERLELDFSDDAFADPGIDPDIDPDIDSDAVPDSGPDSDEQQPSEADEWWEGFDERFERDEKSYRNAPPVSQSVRRQVLFAWCGVALSPIVLFFTTATRTAISPGILWLMFVVSVGSAVYLFWQLPQRRPDDPGGGAQV